MKRLSLIFLLLLAACGEREQVMQGQAVNRGDVAAYKGGVSGPVAAGWTAGDKTSWDKQMQARAQKQNEYNRINR